MQSGFHLYNASAGSGKTYQLTKAYLKLVLVEVASQRFRQILALTFTNKAVGEMKTRILESLHFFGSSFEKAQNDPLFNELCIALQIPPKELSETSFLALRLLLHNYTFFEISTIDKFTHRLVKTFAKDLKVAQNFEVELDSEVLLDEAINQLFEKIDANEDLQKVLISFSLEKIAAEKTWDITMDLKETGKLLFKEQHQEELKSLQNFGTEDFKALQARFKEKIEIAKERTITAAEQTLALMTKNDLHFTDFKRQSLPKFMLSIQAGNINVNFDAAWKQQFHEQPLYNKSAKTELKAKLDMLHPQFSSLFDMVKKGIQAQKFYNNVYGNIVPLTVLNELQKEITKIQNETQTIHISEFNKLIAQEIRNQPTPYIYERLGERYRYYFIDEFQDTSEMQWHNLIPLIGNSLETESIGGEKGLLFIVGDVKQAIYRWRGGNPSQLLNMTELKENPFTITPQIHQLDTNWRSHENIISFNNAFFNHVARYLATPSLQKLYAEQGRQNENHRKGGLVHIGFAPTATKDLSTFYCEKVCQSIVDLIEIGYAYDDICILVRKNGQASIIADYLTQRNIPLISSEALLVAANAEVRFLISLLHYLNSPQTSIYKFEILEYLFAGKSDFHDSVAKHLESLDTLLTEKFSFDPTFEIGQPLTQILERAISRFGLTLKCGAHMFQFLDFVQEAIERNNFGIAAFLDLWHLKKEVLTVAAPIGQQAVQLMTVHKSKGLEFKIVIFPFADSTIDERSHRKKLWISSNEGPEIPIKRLLVNASRDLETYSLASKTTYEEERNLSELDDINVLYVAMTRAVEGLYVFTNLTNATSYGTFFKDYLSEETTWNAADMSFEIGNLNVTNATTSKKSGQIIPYIYRDMAQSSNLAITKEIGQDDDTIQSKRWGITIHEIMSNIHSREDVDLAIERAIVEDPLATKDKMLLKNSVNGIVTHPKLKSYFDQNSDAHNEKELITNDGHILRPDRLVFHSDGVIVLDYKTGHEVPEHRIQIDGYAKVLEEMGFTIAQKILVYVSKTINPVFI